MYNNTSATMTMIAMKAAVMMKSIQVKMATLEMTSMI